MEGMESRKGWRTVDEAIVSCKATQPCCVGFSDSTNKSRYVLSQDPHYLSLFTGAKHGHGTPESLQNQSEAWNRELITMQLSESMSTSEKMVSLVKSSMATPDSSATIFNAAWKAASPSANSTVLVWFASSHSRLVLLHNCLDNGFRFFHCFRIWNRRSPNIFACRGVARRAGHEASQRCYGETVNENRKTYMRVGIDGNDPSVHDLSYCTVARIWPHTDR